MNDGIIGICWTLLDVKIFAVSWRRLSSPKTIQICSIKTTQIVIRSIRSEEITKHERQISSRSISLCQYGLAIKKKFRRLPSLMERTSKHPLPRQSCDLYKSVMFSGLSIRLSHLIEHPTGHKFSNSPTFLLLDHGQHFTCPLPSSCPNTNLVSTESIIDGSLKDRLMKNNILAALHFTSIPCPCP